MVFAWQKLTDARGRKHSPCTIRQACKASGYAKEQLIRAHETGRFWSGAWLMGLMYAVFMTIFGALIGQVFGVRIAFPFLSLPGQVQFWVYAISFGAAIGVINKIYGWRSVEAAGAAFARAGLCAACAYRIDEVVPEQDGCTVCPECGAAWRMP